MRGSCKSQLGDSSLSLSCLFCIKKMTHLIGYLLSHFGYDVVSRIVFMILYVQFS